MFIIKYLCVGFEFLRNFLSTIRQQSRIHNQFWFELKSFSNCIIKRKLQALKNKIPTSANTPRQIGRNRDTSPSPRRTNFPACSQTNPSAHVPTGTQMTAAGWGRPGDGCSQQRAGRIRGRGCPFNYRTRNSSSASLTAAGSSIVEEWPAPGIITSFESGIFSCIRSAISDG